MKKIVSFLAIALLFATTITKAQTAVDFYGMDCNGTMHNMFSELDAGKAVILHFYMPSCGSCPPPAQKIQSMANNILSSHPGTITAYAFPFENVTTCAYSSTWVSSNGLSLYSPMDSGASQVAYYGGFGMPTIVLLGGTNHRVMFSTQAFSTSDTTIMRDSILALLGVSPSAVNDISETIQGVNLFPNPANHQLSIQIELSQQTNLLIDMIDITGRQIAVISDEKVSKGVHTKFYNTEALSNGIYSLRIKTNDKMVIKKLEVAH